MWGAFIFLWGPFPYVGGLFLLIWGIFGACPITKVSAGAHAPDDIVNSVSEVLLVMLYAWDAAKINISI